MKAMIKITYKDGKSETYFDGDFFAWQFKNDLEDRNTAFIKIDNNFIRKDQIRSASAFIKKTEGETK